MLGEQIQMDSVFPSALSLESLLRCRTNCKRWSIGCKCQWVIDCVTWSDHPDSANDPGRQHDQFPLEFSLGFLVEGKHVESEIELCRAKQKVAEAKFQGSTSPADRLVLEEGEYGLIDFSWSKIYLQLKVGVPLAISFKYMSIKWRSWFSSYVSRCSSTISCKC